MCLPPFADITAMSAFHHCGHSSSPAFLRRATILSWLSDTQGSAVFWGKLAWIATVAAVHGGADAQPQAPPARPFSDSIQGLVRQDPYRWMEIGGADFDAWTQQEAAWARGVLDRIEGRAALHAEIQALDRPASGTTSLQVRSGRWIYDTLQISSGSRASMSRIGDDGIAAKLNLMTALPQEMGPWSEVRHARVLSPNGRYLLFGTTRQGEADPSLRVYDLQSARLLPDIIEWPLWADSRGFRATWLADSSGFFYVRNPDANAATGNRDRARRGKVFLHRLGTPATQDRPSFGFGITEGIEETDTLYVEGEPVDRWLPVLNRKASGREIWVVDLQNAGAQSPARLVYRSDALVPGFGVRDGKLYTLDTAGAERYRLIAIDLRSPASAPLEVLPQQEGVLGNLQVSGDGVYIVESVLGASRLHVIDGDNRRTIELPQGSVESVGPGPDGQGAWLEITSWLQPRSGWLVRPGATAAVSLDEQTGDRAAETEANITELHWATGRDGVLIPYTVVRRADRIADGSAYVLMSGYGCYGTVNSPFYWPALEAWLKRGGIFVQAGIRGGGELGSAWHLAGSDRNKPTSFEDAIDTVRHLIASGWTRPGRVGVSGGSCGGATMGMAALEAPHLIGAAILSAAALDMNRIAAATTAGARSIREFGDPETPEGLRRIDALSPYRQLLPGADRPAFLLMSGATDYTIPLWVAGKFVAAARATNARSSILWRIDSTSGHNVGRDYAAEDADMMAFLFRQLGHPEFAAPQ